VSHAVSRIDDVGISAKLPKQFLMGNEVLRAGRSRRWRAYPITRDQGFCCGGRDVDSEKGKNDSLVFVPAEDGVSAAFMLPVAGGVGFHTHRSSCLGARSLNSSSTQDFTHHAIRASTAAMKQPTSPDTLLPSYATY